VTQKNSRTVHTIIVSYGDGLAPVTGSFDHSLPIDNAFAVRLLHRLGAVKEGIDSFYESLQKEFFNIHELTTQKVLQAYFAYLNPTKQEMDVIIAVDEFHKLITDRDGVTELCEDVTKRQVPNSRLLLEEVAKLLGTLQIMQIIGDQTKSSSVQYSWEPISCHLRTHFVCQATSLQCKFLFLSSRRQTWVLW